LNKKKYEQPLLVNLNFTDFGSGKCQVGSADTNHCKTGPFAARKCKAGGSEIANKCKLGSFVK